MSWAHQSSLNLCNFEGSSFKQFILAADVGVINEPLKFDAFPTLPKWMAIQKLYIIYLMTITGMHTTEIIALHKYFVENFGLK